MSILFTPRKIGEIEVKNRFVHSATYEGMADASGRVTDQILRRYNTLAKGGVGAIIPGFMHIHPLGRPYKYHIGIHNDDMIPGLRDLVDSVHREGAHIFFQISHAGRQTCKEIIGQIPMAPSDCGRDPVYFFKPRMMTEAEIDEAIKAYGAAAGRAAEAKADGVQIHAAHGFLINQFLSPFFNRRKDSWGGSAENRFRFLKYVIAETRKNIPNDMPVLVKLNTCDYTPREGVTPSLAVKYAVWLSELGIDMLEVSCGTAVYSYMNMCRGDVPVKELMQSLPAWKRPIGRLMIGSLKGKYDIEEGYNLDAAKMIKSVLNNIPLGLVGGMRTKEKMEEAIADGHADFISMSRPFIREPFIVNKFKEGKRDAVACVSCNKCMAALPNGMPVRCYNKKFLSKRE